MLRREQLAVLSSTLLLSIVSLQAMSCDVEDCREDSQQNKPWVPCKKSPADTGGSGGNTGSVSATVSGSTSGPSSSSGMPIPCGNGQREDSEECDDGNTVSEDGCTSECKVEFCYTCTDDTPNICTSQAGKSCENDTFCNPKGQCVEHCFDAVKDSGEVGVDCGGLCGLCLGKNCGPMVQCASGFCVDGVCCDVACEGQCLACNLSGKKGECSEYPAGIDDFSSMPSCGGAGGTCGVGATCVDKKKNDDAECVEDAECASGACPPGSPRVCKQAAGTPCDNNELCASNTCTGNLCAP